jgi:hypothetical protein
MAESRAIREMDILAAIAEKDNEPLVLEFRDEILALIRKFGESGQSGGSAPFIAQAISSAVKKLCLHEVLTPLTGVDEEWGTEVEPTQNNRDSAVFKDEFGAHYIYAIVWQGQDRWDTFTGHVDGVSSSQYIKNFPFTPQRFYIDVIREPNTTHPDRVSCGDGDYLYRIKDKSQLDAVFEVYRRPSE